MKRKNMIVIILIIGICSIIIGIKLNKLNQVKIYHEKFVLKQDEILNIHTARATSKEEITSLKKEYNNKDIVGILEIENTNYVVPLVQGNDNDYYLKHLPNKEYSFMGSIFLDYRVNVNTSKKLIIYGHNSSQYQMPFDILENYYDENYLKEHKYVTIKTSSRTRRYELFSIYIEPEDFSYMKVNFTNEEYEKHLNDLKNKSMYFIDTNLNKDNSILILQTCSTHKDYKKYKKKYLILAFKEI